VSTTVAAPSDDLARRQRALLALLKGREPDVAAMADDAYLQAVAESPRLAVMRDIDVFWKEHSFRARCPFTAGLLQHHGQLHDEVTRLIRDMPLSPFMEEMARDFLERCTRHPNPLVATLAQFELALTLTSQGDEAEYRITWTHEPYRVLGALLDGRAEHIEPADAAQQRYVTVVSAALPERFRVEVLPG